MVCVCVRGEVEQGPGSQLLFLQKKKKNQKNVEISISIWHMGWKPRIEKRAKQAMLALWAERNSVCRALGAVSCATRMKFLRPFPVELVVCHCGCVVL